MKKVYLLGGFALLSLASFGQFAGKNNSFGGAKLDKRDITQLPPPASQNTTESQDRALNIVWTEDFAGATPLVTSNGTWTTGGANGGYWSLSSSTSHMFVGFPFGLDGRHLRWNSYTPTGTEGGGFATTVVNGHITSPTMDLTGATNGAVLQFDVQSMYCCNYQEKPWNLYVSEDNGASWSTAIPLDFGVDRNVATEDVVTPMTFSVDITPYIQTTPGTVMIRIAWEATAADPNGQYNTHYYWMIDDMMIYELPAYEVQHEKMWVEDVVNFYEYGDISLNQAPTLTVQSQVKSIGENVPTGFGLEVTVFDGSMTQIHQSTGGTLAGPLGTGVTEIITFPTTFDLSTLSPGEYTVRGVITYNETDEATSNDTLFRTFAITDNIFSHRNYDAGIGGNYQGGSGNEPFQIGAAFILYENATLYGADMYIRSGTATYPSTDDAVVEFYVYQDDGGSLASVPGGGPFKFTLNAGMQDQNNTFNFNLHEGTVPYTPLNLVAGTEYVVVMSVEGGDVVWYGSNPIDDDNSGLLYYDNTWYLAGDEPLIALNFDQTLSLESNEISTFAVGQNIPNPFNNTSVINYSLQESANVVVTFTDVAGKVVKTIAPGTQDAGTYSITIDGTDMSEGVYFYTFTIGDNKVTKQMVVLKN